jgi:hypothetical protein
MEDWLRGIAASGICLSILYILYLISVSSTVVSAGGAIACTIIGFATILSLIYSMEEDSLLAGFLIPILIAAAFVIGYFTNAPVPNTAYAFMLAGLLAMILVSEGD